MDEGTFDVDVLVIGSGFGGSVAALRFAEAGQRVTVLERGPWVTRESFEADLDALWNPARHRFGMNDLKPRGSTIIPWLGAGVGGGSHVYAATLKRRDHFDEFPAAVASDDMGRYYDRAEDVMDAQPFPEHAPYADIRATQLLFDAGKRLKQTHPELIEKWGPINLGISFAPEGSKPGADFVNKHGAPQRYSDPNEQSLLGGDIEAKNSLDLNYLHLAQKHGATIEALCEADKIEVLPGDGYRVHFGRYHQETNWFKRWWRQWRPFGAKAQREPGSITAKRVVLAAGAIGSTELLMRNRDVHGTLTAVSKQLGARYTSNGDTFTLMFPFRGIGLSWLGLGTVIAALITKLYWVALPGAAAYYGGLWLSRKAFDPDVGPTNSDYIRFRAQDGTEQGVYIEGGRYPTPVRLGFAVALSAVGLWRPSHYRSIIGITNVLRRFVPPFDLLARTWPIPLLTMGRDDAVGTFYLNKNGLAEIDYNKEHNQRFYKYINKLGRLVSKTTRSHWAPNPGVKLLGKLEIPHNQGGCPMGESAGDGVVDHAGRVFGYRDLMVLDGSIIPVSPGPNPALTILALSERAMDHAVAQLKSDGTIVAERQRASA